MATLTLDILVIQTYNVKTLRVDDASVYPVGAPAIINPSIEITPPGFSSIAIPFNINTYNLFNSTTLGISSSGEEALPDGIYHLRYSVFPTLELFVNKSFMRTDAIQAKFDDAFLQSELMECDHKLKEQSKVMLNTIYFLIQGAIATANNCATVESMKLYTKANSMLDKFLSNGCGCK